MNTELALAELVGLFAPSLGVAKATEIVDRAAAQLGFGARVTLAQAVQVLGHLGREPGIVGITARLAATRLKRKYAPGGAPPSEPEAPPPSLPPPSEEESAGPLFERVVDALAGTLGRQKARDEVEAARVALQLGLPLKHGDCMALLEQLGAGTGIVSTTARFAKVRFLLNGPKR